MTSDLCNVRIKKILLEQYEGEPLTISEKNKNDFKLDYIITEKGVL